MDNYLNSVLQTIVDNSIDIVDQIKAGYRSFSLSLRRSARLPVTAALNALLQTPVLIITDRSDHALTLLEELSFWAPGVPRLIFPEPNPLFYEKAAWGENTRRERLLTLTTLAASHIPKMPSLLPAPIIISPVRALMTRTMPRREFLGATRILKKGQRISLDELVRDSILLGYEPVNAVIAPGQLAHRGGILDIWSSVAPHPVRIEFFGDELDTLRFFEPATQRTLLDPTGSLSLSPERLLVTPAREYLLPEEFFSQFGEGISVFDSYEKALEISEFQIPILHHQPASLLDYLPRETLILIDDRQACEDIAVEIEEQSLLLRKDYIAQGNLDPDYPLPYLSWSELIDSINMWVAVELGPSASGEVEDKVPSLEMRSSLNDRFEAGARFGGRLKQVMEYLVERYWAGEIIVIVSRQAARLRELWGDLAIRSGGDHQKLIPPAFIEGSLGEGWIFYPRQGAVVNLLTDGEIFGWRRPKPRYRRSEHYAIASEDPETIYSDLNPGDFVVHVDHGIGQYIGLVRRTVEGLEREYLCIEFAEGAQLFVPVHQVDRLTRYVGADNRIPTLSRLGSAEWKNVKQHVKEAVQEVAEDLLELYARRSVVEGFPFSVDTVWQQELEASFPYIETDDQIRVLAEVKRDMENPRPMDRLICGDVGYGKTEVALRAAFKAVNDGKQVAVLVPTTVLAQQHFHTFQERLSAFPVIVEMLSRFRTPQQQREIIEDLEKGKIDIIIGTHRLLSSDVKFNDLGLLIIDEEQRFGVTHKEALKKMRTEVDVLTLTATPIPRTLYMALSGVRDISTINTPPEERLPIITHVGPYSPSLARQAILRELERGGQVFFVHNRVQTIGAMCNHLQTLVPEARTVIAHGQMPENELSTRMEKFTNGEVDVLLSTSIIESGLDIPNANTLIVDRADTFGLAQLYQLRGRVGRGAQRAYAYFFRHKRKPPSEEGRQRLDTIAENTQLGAGFSIAMRDLEIRGTGDILGTRQHGHIAAVGFYLYTRLLSEAVKHLRADKGLPLTSNLQYLQSQLPSVSVELPLPSSIPAEYIVDKTVRLGLYRRLAGLHATSEVHAIQAEFIDRFGPLPEVLKNLLFHVEVRILADEAGLATISSEANQIVLRFPLGQVPSNLPELGPLARIGKTAIWVPYMNIPDWQEKLFDILNRIKSSRANQSFDPDREYLNVPEIGRNPDYHPGTARY